MRIDKSKSTEKSGREISLPRCNMEKLISIAKMMLEKTRETIHAERFYLNAWIKEHFYPRPKRCKIPFDAFVVLLLKASKKSIQVELNNFLVERTEMSETFSKQAFSKRRQLIKPEAIKELYQVITDTFYKEANYKTLQGYMVVAIDGSRINLPDSADIEEYFGNQITGNVPQNQALSSCAFDILNGLYLDAVISPCKSSERDLAEDHIDYINHRYGFEKTLYLFDRGYPSAKLLKKLTDCGLKYLFRCDKTFVKGIKDVGDDCLVTHKFVSASEEMTFRMVRLKLSDEIEEILITNLSEDCFTKEDLKELYHLRWGIETSYDHAKNDICIENFSGLTAIAIQQDYYASMYLFNLSAGFIYDAEGQFNKEHNDKGNKYVYKQNLAVTIGTLKPFVTKMLLAQSETERDSYLLKIASQVAKAASKVDPNRQFNRTKKHKTSKFSNSRRPTALG